MSTSLAAIRRDPHEALHRRVAPLCHVIRFVALAWIAWASVAVVGTFATPAKVAASYGRLLHLDLSSLPMSGYLAALLVILVDLAIAWLVVIFIWRLFGRYLKGEIFSLAAVDEMRRGGWMGVTAVLADVAARPLVAYALAFHLDAGQRHHFWTMPNDLLHLLLALFIVALAHIFRAGVEIADDNRQIV